MHFPDVVLKLPDWVKRFLPEPDGVFPTIEERMRLVITLSGLNVKHGTGGPFAAAIFEKEGGRLIAPGINLVVPARCSVAHAEILSIMIAQQKLGSYDLSRVGTEAYELASSTEPCAMCLGAIPWSGIRRLVSGARDEDARRMGFDEGAKPAGWAASLEAEGIEVIPDVLRHEAQAVLIHYRDTGGIVYNASR